MFRWIRRVWTDHQAYRQALYHLANAGFDGNIDKAIERLYSYRVNVGQYRQWLSEFPDVATVLDNLRDETECISPFLDACHPPGPKGPWTISSLREVLRRRLHDSRIGHYRKPDDINNLLHVLRNPYGYTDDYVAKIRHRAADLLDPAGRCATCMAWCSDAYCPDCGRGTKAPATEPAK